MASYLNRCRQLKHRACLARPARGYEQFISTPSNLDFQLHQACHRAVQSIEKERFNRFTGTMVSALGKRGAFGGMIIRGKSVSGEFFPLGA
jgi:hypothetical protein